MESMQARHSDGLRLRYSSAMERLAGSSTHVFSYFFAALTFAHLALFAALIRARPAAEM